MARLESICSVNMGQSPDSFSYNETGEGIPFFQGNADFGEMNPIIRVWCSAPTKIAHDGDILISMRAPIGALNIANTECCIGRGLAALTVKEKVCEKKYLWYGITSKVDELNYKGTGSTFKAISKKVLAETEISVPSMEEQQQIAATLDKVTYLISLRKKQLAKLDELVKSQFIKMFGDPVYNPLGWSTMSIDKVCESIVDCPHSTPSYTNENTGYMCIRTSIIKKNKLLWNEIEYIPRHEYEKRIKRRKPQNGDIVYSREGAILGIAAIINRECNIALGQRSMLLSPDKNKCCSEFLCIAMNFNSFLDRALEKVGGSASPHINVGDIKEFRIIVPPLAQQKQFARFTERVDKSEFEIQKSLKNIETIKKALMQQYFGRA